MANINLSPRLALVKSFIRMGDRVADIGTDHAQLPVYLVKSGMCRSVTASDIGSGPLESGRRTAAEAGVADKIKFVQAAGLSGIIPGEADTFVIAGMGGETIAGIIDECPWAMSGKNRFILQPQSKLRELLSFCGSTGLEIQDAGLVRDAGRLYVAFLCVSGREGGSLEQLFKALRKKGDPLIEEYREYLAGKLRKRLMGLCASSNGNEVEAEEIRHEIEKIKSL